jgi:hypothetical protein
MEEQKLYQFFHSRFTGTSRPEREKILCAMIRVNYGTSWDGDLDRLRNFFPAWYHKKLLFGGLTDLIESLSPFSDEPTDSGIVVDETTLSGEDTERFTDSEPTASLHDYVPEVFDKTLTLKNLQD